MGTDYGRPPATSTDDAGIDGSGAVQNTVEEARGYLQSAVDQAHDKMTEYREHGWGRVQGDVIAYARSHPRSALGTAVGIGLLLGWLSSKGRR